MSICIVGRKYLEEIHDATKKAYKNFCDNYWNCALREDILNEFDKKRFFTFNSTEKGWKVTNTHLNFKIEPF